MADFLEGISQKLNILPPEDPIHECGPTNVQNIKDDPAAALKEADAKLHVWPFKDVRTCWRRLYTDASLVLAVRAMKDGLLGESETSQNGCWNETQKAKDASKERGTKRAVSGSNESADGSTSGDPSWLTKTVRLLDMALIMTGGCGRENTITIFFQHLDSLTKSIPTVRQNLPLPARKRVKRSADISNDEIPIAFPNKSLRIPDITHPVKRCTMTMSSFQEHLNNPSPMPLVLKGVIDHWGSEEKHEWHSPMHLLNRTLGGRRLVPIELGRSYTDEDWGQKIMPFRDFMQEYLLNDASEQHVGEGGKDGIAYLAQHDLFAQIPDLRKDVAIPELCYTDPPGIPPESNIPVDATKKLEEPLLNAWFGPAGTISPLHTDPYHNILCQVVGKKYVRLYGPSETHNLAPRGNENGIDMSNTSSIPVEVVEMGAIAADDVEDERLDRFQNARYYETILSDMESLYIPVGWWHYVRSLSISCSVSFWWN